MKKKILCYILLLGSLVNIFGIFIGTNANEYLEEMVQKGLQVDVEDEVESQLFTFDVNSILKEKVVIIDAGHCVNNDNVFKGYSESTAMLNLSLELKNMLESKGVLVHLIRPTGECVSLPVRVAKINLLSLELLELRAEFSFEELKEIVYLKRVMQSIKV